MPGFTHLQVAQPVTFGHHLLAYVEMFARDAERLRRLPPPRQPAAARRAPRWPAPAIRSTASASRATLGFDGVVPRTRSTRCRDRDFAIEFAAAAALVHGAPVALRRRAGAVDEPALRLHRPRRPLLHRLVDHAAEEEPRRARARRAARPAA